MKRGLALLIAIVAMLIPAKAQDDAMYVYRNDGPLNAFLMERVDSMSFSNIGVDGLEYAVPVVQEIWTKDSLYRIPISAIDSIGYQTPEPILKKDLFLIDESNVSYVKAVNEEALAITFNSSAASLPTKGQIIFCDLMEEPFPMGFAGRVKDIQSAAEGFVYVCEIVNPDEVYDRLLVVGHVGSDGEEYSSAKRRLPRKKHVDATYNINVPLFKLVKISGKGTFNVDYTIDINAFNDEPVNCQVLFQHDTEWDLGIQWKKDDVQGAIPNPKDKKELLKEYWNTPITLFDVYGLKLQGKLGGYFSYTDGFSVELTGLKYKSSRKDQFFYNSDMEPKWSHTLLTDEGGWNFEDGIGGIANDIRFKMEVASKISFGVCAELDLAVWKPKWASIGIGLKVGPEFKGSFTLDSEVFKTAYNEGAEIAVYKQLSEDVKFTFGVGISADLIARALGKEWKLLSASTTLFPQTVTLLPKLSKPALPKLFLTKNNRYMIETNNGWDFNLGWNSNNPFAIRTTASNSIIFPGPIGVAIYDTNDNLIDSKCAEGFGNWHWMKKSGFEMDLPQLKPQTVKLYPIYKFLGVTGLRGESSEITIPESMTLSKTSIEVAEGRYSRIYINGGWGYYEYEPLEYQHIAPRELKIDENGKYYILVYGEKAGKTDVVVKDARSGKICKCDVTVTPTPIELSADELQMRVGEVRVISIYPMTTYQFESSNPDVASVSLDMTNQLKQQLLHLKSLIQIEALSIGHSTITIKDPVRGHTVTIDVQVRESGPGVITINPSKLDFGTVMLGSEKKKTFKVSNTGETEFSFTIGEVGEPFNILDAYQSYKLLPEESKTFTVICSGLEDGDEKSIFVPIETTIPGSSGNGIVLKAEGDKYTEGMCIDIYPEDNAVLEGTGSSFDCKIIMPFSGEMNITYLVSDKPDMSHLVKQYRVTGNGRVGDTIRAFYTYIDGLQPNTQYWWRINYFNFETERFENCSPIRTFTTGSE